MARCSRKTRKLSIGSTRTWCNSMASVAKEKSGFYLVDNRIIEEYGKEIGVYGIAVYNVIAKFANADGEGAFPSYQTIADSLGVSRRKVIDAMSQLVELGLIEKEARLDEKGDPTSNVYSLVSGGGSAPHALPSAQNAPQVVHRMHQGSAPHAPDQYPVNKTQLEQEEKQADAVAPQPDTKPKNEKKAKKSKDKPSIPEGQDGKEDNEKKEKVLTPQQEYFGALCWVIGWDHGTITEKQSGQVAQTLGILQNAKYSIDDLRAFWRDVWTSDWRWTKEHQRPTLSQVRAEIGKVKTAHVNGFSKDTSTNKSIAVIGELEK